MSGMFAATDQNHYEINIPSPHTYETEEEAMADGAFGYRFVLLPGGKGPQVVIFEGSGFRLVCDGKENYIKDENNDYITLPNKTYKQVSINKMKLECHNNNWQYIIKNAV